MQDEMTWMANQSADESAAKERYEYFTRPEPRENMSDIYWENDKYLGRCRCRDVKVGMVRNAAEENRKVVKAYLDPFPHIRIDQAKPLQGWYQSKTNESKQSRPRPCFTEAVLTEPYGGYCAVGCQFSLPAGELVDTPLGQQAIESFEIGELVWGRSIQGRVAVMVVGVSSHYKPEGLIELEVSDGRLLRMTGDHPVYSRSRGWITAESLQTGEELEDASMCFLSQANNGPSVLPQMLRQSQNQTVEAMQRLRGRHQTKQTSVRQLQPKSQSSKRQTRQSKRKALEAVSRNQGQDVTHCLEEQRKYVKEGKGAKVGCIQSKQSRRYTTRKVGLQTCQASVVYRSHWQAIQNAVNLGGFSSQLLRQATTELGLRANGIIFAKWSSVSSRLSFESYWLLSRSQRLHDSRRLGQDNRSQKCGVRNNLNGSKTNGASRHPYVKKVTRVQGGVWVYDIETETGNFYQQGILVHNCYINSGMRGYRGTGLISVPLDYAQQINTQLSKMRRGAAGYFSSFTDPFTPLESFYHNTQRAAEEFIKVGLPIFFLSRLSYPGWAIDLLTKNPHSYAQKSINTCDANDWRHLSPGAISLKHHLQEITKLKKRGIYISIQVNPIVPGITTNEQILKLFTMLKNAGADHVIVKFVEAAYSWAPSMVTRLKKVFGEERGRKFEELFTQNIGSERTIDEEYRLNSHKLLSAHARKLGLTYATCYEYRYERDETGKVLNKTGVSIGREFTTASQCHGHQVPVYSRDSNTELFKPLDYCPPSGCLYCADENNGEPRCGDTLAGSAKALKLVDLKIPMELVGDK